MTGNANLWSWKGEPVNKHIRFSHLFNVLCIRNIFIPQAVRWFLLKGFHSTRTSGLPMWRDKREDQTKQLPEIIWEFIVILQDVRHDEQCNQICSGSLNAQNLHFIKKARHKSTNNLALKTKHEGKHSVCPHVSKCACKTRALQI